MTAHDIGGGSEVKHVEQRMSRIVTSKVEFGGVCVG